MPPHVRAAMACFFAFRYETVLKKKPEAENFLPAAVAVSRPDSPLRKLAQAELDRLKAKP